jgi:hypothetical protein
MAIDPRMARACLDALKELLTSNKGSKLDKRYIEAIDMAMDAVAPQIGGGHCEWIYLPDKDLTPYSHIRIVTEMTSEISTKRLNVMKADANGEKHIKPVSITITGDQLEAVEMALEIYKSVLMKVNKEEMREAIRKAMAEQEKQEANPDGKSG